MSKIVWRRPEYVDGRNKPLQLQAKSQAEQPGTWPSNPGWVASWGLRDEDMDPIQAWSREHNCGIRMSFDIWEFKNEADLTMFLLRWA